MKHLSLFVVVTVLSGFLAERTLATEIVLSTTSSPMAGVIKASGTFKVDMGFTATAFTITCSPVGGGKGNEGTGSPLKPNWSGMVVGLDSSTEYNVQAKMTVQEDGTSNLSHYYSAIKTQKADGK